jgi:hypothetical protein
LDGHQIKDGPAGAQLNQSHFIFASLYRAPKCAAVEAEHFFEVDHA